MEPLVWQKEELGNGEVIWLASDVCALPFTSHRWYVPGPEQFYGVAFLIRNLVLDPMPPGAPFGWAFVNGIGSGGGLKAWIPSIEEGKNFCEQWRKKYWELPNIREALRLEEELAKEARAFGDTADCSDVIEDVAGQLVGFMRESDRKDESYIKQLYRVVCTNHLCPTESWKYRTRQEAVDWWNKREGEA